MGDSHHLGVYIDDLFFFFFFAFPTSVTHGFPSYNLAVPWAALNEFLIILTNYSIVLHCLLSLSLSLSLSPPVPFDLVIWFGPPKPQSYHFSLVQNWRSSPQCRKKTGC